METHTHLRQWQVLSNCDRVCYWDYFGQTYTEPGEEFPRQRKDKCKGPEAEICSVLEEQKEGWVRGRVGEGFGKEDRAKP